MNNMRDVKRLITILDAIGIHTAAFTAAITGIITSVAHGLKDSDMIVLTTTNTLPAGLSLAIVYIVEQATTNTFKLKKKSDNTHPNITDIGTGIHTWTIHDVGYSTNVEYYTHKEISLDSDGGGDAAMVVKFQGSIQKDEPDFSAAQSVSNQWEYIRVKDLQSGDYVAGDTGITFSSADDYRMFNIESNNIKWINAIISSWTAGEITVKIKCANN